MQLDVSRVISYSAVAHGNPMAGNALARSAARYGLDTEVVPLTVSSVPVNMFHGNISSNPEDAAEYITTSEQKRLGAMAKIFGTVAFGELLERTAKTGRDIDWTVTQEHQLLGATNFILDRAGIGAINLVVPDVFPKRSAVHAASRIDGAVVNVWSQAAYDELTADGVKARLVRPFLLDGYRPDDESFTGGDRVIVKTSGSGMPQDWLNTIMLELRASGEEYSVHTPTWQYQDGFVSRIHRTNQCLDFLFSHIGPETVYEVGYPSESVQRLTEMQMRGYNTQLLALPPRGEHEYRNLMYGFETGVIAGELGFSDDQKPTIPHVPIIPVRSLHELVRDSPSSADPRKKVGQLDYWQQRLDEAA